MQSLWRGDSAGRTLATAEYRCSPVHPPAARAGSSQTPWSHHRSAIPGQAVRHVEGNAVGCRPGMPNPVLSLPWCAQAEPKTDAKELSQVSQDKGETGGSHARWGSSCPSLRSTPALGECAYRGMCIWGMCMGYRGGNRVRCRNVKQRRWTDIPSLGCCKMGWGSSAKSPVWVMPSLRKAPGRRWQSRTLLFRPSQDSFHFQSAGLLLSLLPGWAGLLQTMSNPAPFHML